MSEISIKTNNNSYYDKMLFTLMALIVAAVPLYSARVLLICAVGFVTARVIDVAVATVRGRKADAEDKTGTIAALTFCLMLPVSVPLHIVVMSVSIAVLAGKHAFGGKDVYPFNLSALAMCIAAVNWPEEVFKAVKPFARVNFWTGRVRDSVSVTSAIKRGGVSYVSTLDLLMGNHAGTIGTGFVLIIIALGIYLVVSKRITWHIPVSFLATCAVFSLIFPRIYGLSALYSLKYEMLSSALFFYRVFILCEPATSPQNPKAKIAFGVISGIMSMIFVYYGGYEIGACFAILLVNATEGFWDRLFTGNLAYADLVKEGKAFAPITNALHKSKSEGKKVKYTKQSAKTTETEKAAPNIENTGVSPVNTEKKASGVKSPSRKSAPSKAEPDTAKIEKAEETAPAAAKRKPAAKKTAAQTSPKSGETQDKPKTRKTAAKPQSEAAGDIAVKKKTAKAKADTKQRTTTLDIISRAEDAIDQVEFSTQTIDVRRALRELEKNKGKEE